MESRIAVLRASARAGEAPAPPADEIEKPFATATLESRRRMNLRTEMNLYLAQGKGNWETLDILLADAQAFLVPLHRGARALAPIPPRRFRAPSTRLNSSDLDFMTDVEILHAQRSRVGGRAAEAAEDLLDALQLVRYYRDSDSNNTNDYPLSYLRHPLDEMRDLLAHEILPPSLFRPMAAEFELLDSAVEGPLADLDRRLLQWAEFFSDPSVNQWSMGLWGRSSHRFGFVLPDRLLKADAFGWMEAQSRRMSPGRSAPYSEFQSALREISVDASCSSNPFVQQCSPFVASLGRERLIRKAQLRLLRAAAVYLDTGRVPDLPDPFGDLLLHAETPTGMRIWSVGPDGNNEGGSAASDGRWARRTAVPRTFIDSSDIVIEVPR